MVTKETPHALETQITGTVANSLYKSPQFKRVLDDDVFIDAFTYNSIASDIYEDLKERFDLGKVKPIQKRETFNSTGLGKKLGVSAQKINVLLLELGLQEYRRNINGAVKWLLTHKGFEHAYYGPAQQIRWFESVLEVLHEIHGKD